MTPNPTILNSFNAGLSVSEIAERHKLPIQDVYTAIGLIGDHEWRMFRGGS